MFASDRHVSRVHRPPVTSARRSTSAYELESSTASEAGAGALRLSVKAGNAVALSLYADEGLTEFEIYLEKRLS